MYLFDYPIFPGFRVLQGLESFDLDYRAGDSLDKSLEHFARSYFHEIICFVSKHVLHGLGPFHRRSELSEQILLDEFRILGMLSGNVLVDRSYRSLYLGGLYSLAELNPGRLHER